MTNASQGRGKRWSDLLHLPTLFVLLAVGLVWEALSRRLRAAVPRLGPRGHRGILRSGDLWRHTGASLYRILIGFGSALALALFMGFLTSLWRPARTVVHDVVTILNSTSVFVWIVVSLIWFGLTDLAPMFTTFMITLPVLAANIVEGVVILQHYKVSPLFPVEHSVCPHDVYDWWVSKYGNTLDAFWPVADTEIGRVGIMMANEGSYPENARAFAMNGAEVVYRASYPHPATGNEYFEIQSRARALDNNMYIVAPNMGTYYLFPEETTPIDTSVVAPLSSTIRGASWAGRNTEPA